MNKVREEQGISNEKYGCVVTNQIPIPFFRIKLYCKSPWVSRTVRRAGLSTNGTKPNSNRRLFAEMSEHCGLDVMCIWIDVLSVQTRYSVWYAFIYDFRVHTLQTSVISCVTSKYPNAPAPLAWTTLSGILSRSKWAISSMNVMSCSKIGPRGPAVRVLSLSSTGAPPLVVNLGRSYYINDHNQFTKKKYREKFYGSNSTEQYQLI